MTLKILFEDGDVIAVDKPAGLLSHASVDKTRPDAFRLLHDQLSARDGVSPELALLHRLDRDTSGVLLFSKNKDRHDRLAALFRDRRVEKIYLGIARGETRKRTQWTISNFLAEEKSPTGKTPRTIAVRSGGLPAVTHFRLRASGGGFLLVEARPETGRRHQIRSHLRESRLPLVGDPLYGGPPGPRVLLHAWKLRWPGETAETEVIAPVPADFPLGE